MENDNFNPADSIKTIDEALAQAKAEKTGAQFYYVLWGSLLFCHFALQYIKTKSPQADGDLLDIAIMAVFPIGGFLSYLRSKRDDRTETVVPRFEKIYSYAFGGFALAYTIMFVASAFSNPALYSTFFSLLIGLTVFITGGLTQHKPSIAGGVLAIILAGIGLNAPAGMHFMLAAIASLSSCFIPGILMKNRNV